MLGELLRTASADLPYLSLSLLLTPVLELFAAAVLGIRGRRDILLIAGANILTNPPVAMAACLLGEAVRLPKIIIHLPFEAFAVIVEWLIYRKFGERITEPLAFALLSNVFSYFMGRVILTIVSV